MSKKLFFTLLCSFLFFSAFGQQVDQRIAVDDLKKDFEILRSSLEDIHPGLYNYHSKQEFDSIFLAYKQLINSDLQSLEYYLRMGSLLKEIGDVHTDIEPPESYYDSLNNHWQIFPVSVQWVDEKLYVIRDFSDEQTAISGDQILTINGISAQEVFLNIRQYVPRDGYNLTSPNHILSGEFGQFRNFYPAIYGTPDSYQLEVLKSNGNKEWINVNGITYPRIFEKNEESKSIVKNQSPNKHLQFEIRDQVGILKVQSFHPEFIKEGKQKYKKFFKQVFKRIKKSEVEKLIIDIRGNRGGHESVFLELFKYLADKPFSAYRQLSTVTDKVPNREFFLDQGKIAYLEKSAQKRLIKQGDIFVRTGGIGLKTIQPKRKNYQGAVSILIDGRTSSAAGDFSGLVKAHNRAIFIGEETGGNPFINTAGMRLTLELPHSGIRIFIPTLLYTINHTGRNVGQGMQPDYPIELTIEDILSKKDKVLDFALSLAKERDKNNH